MIRIHRIGICLAACCAFATALQAQDTASVSGAARAEKSNMQLAIASTRSSESLDPYTGVYVTSAGIELIVVADERALSIERADGSEAPVRLTPDTAERGSFTPRDTQALIRVALRGIGRLRALQENCLARPPRPTRLL